MLLPREAKKGQKIIHDFTLAIKHLKNKQLSPQLCILLEPLTEEDRGLNLDILKALLVFNFAYRRRITHN